MSDTLPLTASASYRHLSFGGGYHGALEHMLAQHVGKLLLNLRRSAPASLSYEQWLTEVHLGPQPNRAAQPMFMASLPSEGQYQYSIGSYPTGSTFRPGQARFSYVASHRLA
ncbi:hypothetical protein [Solirubrum puertoriconensis]|uniref:Uncharacterized protein n=1 Tax=Solirubrum puertoriconensis TaxID=1751427 RepID=A0A9X0HHG8_SOLP1|nr:hypothetical protein [Solirubrum puertoriconensis]KUG05973.1 hypothetical protein ASU33_00930 [Solirubrum puertoriconensis]